MLNSSIHLQNVIEDALDMSRLENNKFTIFKELFDARKAINGIQEVMQFQIDAKKLKLNVSVSQNVPSLIEND